MKPLLLTLLLLTLALGLRAQSATLLRGTIHDSQGPPLPVLNGFLRGTFDGTTTDSTGAFRLETSQTGARVLGLRGQPGALRLQPQADRHQLGGANITAGAFETFAPASGIAPNWGRGQLTSILKSYETAAASAQ